MKTYTTTREITVNEEVIAAGATVKASYNEATKRTMVLVDGIGHRSFQVAPVIL